MIRLDGDREGAATVPPGLREGDGTPAAPSRNGSAAAGDAPGIVALVDLVRELQTKFEDAHTVIIARTEAAAMWQARAELLGERLAATESKLLALTAPQTTVEASTAPESPDPATDTPSPWYRRWRAWLAAGLVVAVLGSASCQRQTPADMSPTPAAPSPTPAGVSMKQANLCRAGSLVLDQANVRQGNNPSWTAGYEPQVLWSVIEMLERVC
jgi:hypothetical protein